MNVISSWFGTNLLWIALSSFLALSLLTGYYGVRFHLAESAKELAVEQRNNIRADYDALLVITDVNEAAIQHCQSVNTDNERVAKEQEKKIQEALTTVKLLQAGSKHTTEDIRDGAEKLRNRDTECRTVDEPFPDWFTVGLWE